MTAVVDAFWRAAAYCVLPRIVLMSLLPLLLAAGGVGWLGYTYWGDAVAAVRSTLDEWSLIAAVLHGLESMGLSGLRALVAPLVLVVALVPIVVVVTLVLVNAFVTPVVVKLVAQRRFPALGRDRGAPWYACLGWSLACTAAACMALLLSVPLWFVPPFLLVLPPLIWGWLTFRVFAFDVLADHASADERRTLIHRHRWPLWLMGVVCGYLGALPSLIWAFNAATLIFAPLLVVVSVWLYTLVFVFAAGWFAHYLLGRLQALRRETAAMPPAPPAAPPVPQPAALAA